MHMSHIPNPRHPVKYNAFIVTLEATLYIFVMNSSNPPYIIAPLCAGTTIELNFPFSFIGTFLH